MIATLKEVLDVCDSAFCTESKYIYINLEQCDEIDPANLTKERFINFFESVRKQTDEFNQKIKDDLAKQDSKLRKFA